MQGQVINGFELKRLLGRGGMAEVWYAENEIGKPAAIKILNENLSHNQQIVERFHNEALVMVKLNHPNIRQVYGYGYLGNRHCIVMEYLDGEDLEELLKNGRRFTDEELQRWWNQTVDALNYTHAMDVVHRDIKPSNIFLDEKGNIKLLDFGIAKMMENASLTQTGMVMGTPMYMSPEQVNDIKHVDYHTDLYSLAVSFVHMLTGKKPYDDTNCSVFEIQMNIVTKPLDMSEVPATWQGFLAPYLEKDPLKRPALRHFEAVMPKKEPAKAVADKYDAKTVVDKMKQPEPKQVAEPSPKPLQKHAEAETVSKSQSEETITLTSKTVEESKSKKGLWIALGVVAAVALLLVVLLKPKEEPAIVEQAVYDPDTESYQACRTVSDYRAYILNFGRNAKHYFEAAAFIDQYVTDSTAEAQKALAQAEELRKAEAEALRKAEAEAKAQAEAEKKARQEAEAREKAQLEEKKRREAEAQAKAQEEERLEIEQNYAEGKSYYDNKNYVEALQYLRKPAEKGNVNAQYYLGCIYKNGGNGVTKNSTEAFTWFRKAANQGHVSSQYEVGRMYYLGEGVSADVAEGLKWYHKAANQGDAHAQYSLGYIYENGYGVEKNEAESQKWYQKEANRLTRAQRFMIMMDINIKKK